MIRSYGRVWFHQTRDSPRGHLLGFYATNDDKNATSVISYYQNGDGYQSGICVASFIRHHAVTCKEVSMEQWWTRPKAETESKHESLLNFNNIKKKKMRETVEKIYVDFASTFL